MKKLYIPVAVAAVLAAVLLMMYALSFQTVRLEKPASGSVVYHSGTAALEQPLTNEQAEAAAKIFDGKRLPPETLSGTPSCGFSQDIAIILNGRRFLLAQDSCAIVRDGDTGRYFSIPEAQRQTLEAIFAACGGSFPCLSITE